VTQVPASSHGTTFNGGTITQPLVIDLDDGNSVPLTILASWNAQNVDFLHVLNTDTNVKMFALDLANQVQLNSHTDEAQGVQLSEAGGIVARGNVLLANGKLSASTTPTLGLFGHLQAAQPTLTSGTATPEQIALALQSYGAAGGS
jgi:hypothetical protein